MPRAADPRNELGRRRTERWRKKLELQKSPEACHIDTAVAAALSAYIASIRESGGEIPADIKNVISGSKEILKNRGFDGKASSKKLTSRLLFRRDRFKLMDIVSPHYFSLKNRRFRRSGSDVSGGDLK